MPAPSSDTLSLDTLQLAQWRTRNDYDYDREIAGGGRSVMEWLAETIERWIDDSFGAVISHDTVYYTLVALGGMLVLLTLVVLWRRNGLLFTRIGGATAAAPEATEEDTIYGIDFDAELQRALQRSDYRQAVRLCYLQTLAGLSEHKRIDWQPQKTPSQYVRELGNAAFEQLSRHFIRVRYGNFEATPQRFAEMQQLQHTIEAQLGGNASAAVGQEGGGQAV